MSAPTAAPTRTRRSQFHPLAVRRVDALCPDAAAITFDVPAELAADFAFAAGQSLTLRRTLDGVEHRRSYSICAPVGQAPRIGVREIPDGLFSRWLVRDVRPGDLVDVQTPSGTFRADPTVPGRHLCIAAGSGITPMLSIAASVLAEPGAHVTLVYGNRSTDTVMFAEELADLKNRYLSRIEIVHVLSREPRAVELLSGRLDADRLTRLFTTLVPARTAEHVWLCGPFGMITDARRALQAVGVPTDRVHVEHFYVDEPPAELRRPDDDHGGAEASSTITVVLDGRTTTGPIPRGSSILEGVARLRSDLPFACRGGVCGTCRAVVTDGTVEMRRNYALDADEVARGHVLTCQSRPVTDTLTVDFDA